MQTSKDEEKRSRSPELRPDESTAVVRERTPLGTSDVSQSEDDTSEDEPQLPSLPPRVQDPEISAESVAKEPSMPYFLQLSDMGISS